MTPELKEKWLAALKSGDYKQGTRWLCKGDSYCCLGVLIDITDPSLWIEEDIRIRADGCIKIQYKSVVNSYKFDLHVSGTPPMGLMDKYGISLNQRDRLMTINDAADSFGPVIQYIEENL